MANTMYCDSCGAKNMYEASKPKFCNSCAQPFGATFKAANKPVVNRTVPAAQEETLDWDTPRAKPIKKINTKAAVKINMNRNTKTDDLLHMSENISRQHEVDNSISEVEQRPGSSKSEIINNLLTNVARQKTGQ